MLHLACRAERPEAEILATVQLLLDKGAHPIVQDARGRTPGDISKERGHASVTAALTLGATALEQIETVGKSGFRPQVVKAATPAEVDAALASYASARGSWSGPSEPTPPATASAAARGPKRAGLKLRPGLRMEMQKAAKSGDLHKLKECARKWDAEHPEAPVGFGTDVWVPALWLVAHEAGVAGRVRVLKWLVEDMGVRVHRLLPEEKALIRGSAEATAEPLASAIYGNHEAAVLYLLRAGAERGDIDVGHHCGEEYSTLLFMAMAQNASAGLLTALMEEGGFDPGAREGSYSPLGKAVGLGRMEAMDAILAYARRHGRLESALTCCMASRSPSLFTLIMEVCLHLDHGGAEAAVCGVPGGERPAGGPPGIRPPPHHTQRGCQGALHPRPPLPPRARARRGCGLGVARRRQRAVRLECAVPRGGLHAAARGLRAAAPLIEESGEHREAGGCPGDRGAAA